MNTSNFALSLWEGLTFGVMKRAVVIKHTDIKLNHTSYTTFE